MTTATASELTYRSVDVTPPPRLPAKTGLYGIGYDVLTLGGLSLLALPAFWLLGAFSPLSVSDGRIAAPLIALLGIALIFAGKAKLGLNRTDKWLLMAPI